MVPISVAISIKIIFTVLNNFKFINLIKFAKDHYSFIFILNLTGNYN